jgi:hypothetical protein
MAGRSDRWKRVVNRQRDPELLIPTAVAQRPAASGGRSKRRNGAARRFTRRRPLTATPISNDMHAARTPKGSRRGGIT